MALLQEIKKRFGPLLDAQSPNFETFKELKIDSKEPIQPGCVAWQTSTTTLFLLGS